MPSCRERERETSVKVMVWAAENLGGMGERGRSWKVMDPLASS